MATAKPPSVKRITGWRNLKLITETTSQSAPVASIRRMSSVPDRFCRSCMSLRFIAVFAPAEKGVQRETSAADHDEAERNDTVQIRRKLHMKRIGRMRFKESN